MVYYIQFIIFQYNYSSVWLKLLSPVLVASHPKLQYICWLLENPVAQSTGGPEGAGPHQNGVKMWSYAMSHAYVYCISLHFKRTKTDVAMHNHCPACYSLCWDQKLFNIKVRRGETFASKCTRNCLAVGLCPDPLGELTMLPHTP